MNVAWRRIATVLWVVVMSISSTANVMALPADGRIADRARQAQTENSDPASAAALTRRLYLPLAYCDYAEVFQPFGVEAQNWQMLDPTVLASQVREAGATWTRVNALKWAEVQPVEGGPYYWGKSDRYLRPIGEQGLTPVLTIAFNPGWAALDNENLPSGPLKPEHVADFARFVKAAVTRYSKAPYNVKYYEMYNEPDGSGYLKFTHGIIGMWGKHGAAYAAMLRAVYPAVKAANPKAQVVFGGMAYSNFKPDGFQKQFLDDVLAAGGGNYFDLLNFHYYTPQAAEWSAYGIDILGKVNYLKQKLAAYGYPNKPIMNTESGTFGVLGNTAQLEFQAQYVAKLYARGMSGGLHTVMWYSLIRGADGTGLTENGVRKPAYYAYQTWTRVMADQEFTRVLSPQEVSPNPSSPIRNFEGYAFRSMHTKRALWVVWLSEGTTTIAIRANTLQVTDKLNHTTTLNAGADGLVRFQLTTSPLYVRF